MFIIFGIGMLGILCYNRVVVSAVCRAGSGGNDMLDFEKLCEAMDRLPHEIKESNLDEIVSDFYRKFSRVGCRLRDKLTKIARAMYDSMPGESDDKKEGIIANLKDAFFDFSYYPEYRAFYRGFQLAQANIQGTVDIEDLPETLEDFIDYEGTKVIARAALARIEEELTALRNLLDAQAWALCGQYKDAYLECSRRRAGYYYLAGYATCTKLQQYATKDFIYPEAFTMALAKRLLSDENVALYP